MTLIFHAFNWLIQDVQKHIPHLAKLGFNAVQLSPLQKSMRSERDWYLRYQPYDYSVIEGLGGPEELKALCKTASDNSMLVIADVVFNHMGQINTEAEAKEAQKESLKGNTKLVENITNRLNQFPQFSTKDFHPFKPIGGFDYDNDETRFDGWGGEGTWPDLAPTENVISVQKAHLKSLFDCGVRGFRFDAVKQMYIENQYLPLAKCALNLGNSGDETQLVYGEVLSLNKELHEKYAKVASSTDFLLMHELVQHIETQPNLAALKSAKHLDLPAVCFATNHDTVEQFLHGLSFKSKMNAALATAFLVATSKKPVLLLDTDVEVDSNKLAKTSEGKKAVHAALDFRRKFGLAKVALLHNQEGCEIESAIALQSESNPKELLIIELPPSKKRKIKTTNQALILNGVNIKELTLSSEGERKTIWAARLV